MLRDQLIIPVMCFGGNSHMDFTQNTTPSGTNVARSGISPEYLAHPSLAVV